MPACSHKLYTVTVPKESNGVGAISRSTGRAMTVAPIMETRNTHTARSQSSFFTSPVMHEAYRRLQLEAE